MLGTWLPATLKGFEQMQEIVMAQMAVAKKGLENRSITAAHDLLATGAALGRWFWAERSDGMVLASRKAPLGSGRQDRQSANHRLPLDFLQNAEMEAIRAILVHAF